jgi:serine/threonine protein kinase
MTEEAIFQAALARADAAERAAFLDEACSGKPALRQRVEALLRSHAAADSFLDVPALVRQANADSEPSRTTVPPAGAKADEEPLAFLAPGSEPGSLGRLDHYEVLELVGRGGMGLVFKARDTRLQRIVAIKVLAALAASGTARQRFFREARAAAAVRDEHVVSIHAVSDDSGAVPYLVMELIAGSTLEKRLRERGPLAVKEVLRIGMQAARGLAAAHAQGLIHRDVKPANILLENGVERVKLTDFGLARTADDASLSQSGVIAGTPLYMSPEQARGEPLDGRSDLFSLGSVLYATCTGGSPFQAGNTMAVLKRVCEDVPRPIREVNPDVPDWLAAVVDRLLAKEPAQRFQSAAELAEVLGQRLAQVQQSRLTPAAPPERPAAQAQAAPQVPRKRRRLAVAAVLLGLGVVAASLGIVAYLAWPSTNRERAPDGPREQPDPPGPPVLTVSQKPEGGGRFRTIGDALDNVEPGMTIRVLDDAVYEEYLQISKQHNRVVLEAKGKAAIRRLPEKHQAVWLHGVSDFTLRGFRFPSPPDKGAHAQVYVSGRCPGVVLDRLDMTTGGHACVNLYDVPLSGQDAPLVIQNCTMRGGPHGVLVEGSERGNRDHSLPCGRLVIRNNTLVNCDGAVRLQGEAHQVHVVGNLILDAGWHGIDLVDPLPGTADILIANNTLWRNAIGMIVWDDHKKGKAFLECRNIRFQNNLLLDTRTAADLLFQDHTRSNCSSGQPGDLDKLLKSPQWRFSHNGRQTDPRKAASQFPGRWIPRCPNDHLEKSIEVLSDDPRDRDFLRPPKDSPLARGGAGVTDPALPAYVGAVPPEGAQPWDWDKTWKMLVRQTEVPDVKVGDKAPDQSKLVLFIDDDCSDPAHGAFDAHRDEKGATDSRYEPKVGYVLRLFPSPGIRRATGSVEAQNTSPQRTTRSRSRVRLDRTSSKGQSLGPIGSSKIVASSPLRG